MSVLWLYTSQKALNISAMFDNIQSWMLKKNKQSNFFVLWLALLLSAEGLALAGSQSEPQLCQRIYEKSALLLEIPTF